MAVRLRLRELAIESWRLGRKIGVYFLAYMALGYLVIELVPTAALLRLLGGTATWGVPLAALLGIPVYITSEASLPMVAALMHGGLGAGPAMAFLTTGAGTSVGAISGMLLIARRRVVGIVLASLLVGAVALGWIASAALGWAGRSPHHGHRRNIKDRDMRRRPHNPKWILSNVVVAIRHTLAAGTGVGHVGRT